MSFEEGLKLAKQNQMNFIESSAKAGTNIESIFDMLVHNILEKIDSEAIDVFTHPGIKLGTLKYKNIIAETKREVVVTGKDKSKRRCC